MIFRISELKEIGRKKVVCEDQNDVEKLPALAYPERSEAANGLYLFIFISFFLWNR